MQRRDGDSITLDDTLADCDDCAARKIHQLAYPKKTRSAHIKAPFQPVQGYSVGHITPAVQGDYKFMSKVTTVLQKDRRLLALQEG